LHCAFAIIARLRRNKKGGIPRVPTPETMSTDSVSGGGGGGASAAIRRKAPPKKGGKDGFAREMRRNWTLYMLTLPALLFLLVFRYAPMFGIIIAFKKFIPIEGIIKSPFVGLENFVFFFRGSLWKSVSFNTFYLNALFILTGTVAAIFLAIALSELGRTLYVRISQSVMILPNFISWVVIALFAVAFLGGNGVINKVIESMGYDPILFYNEAKFWPKIFVIIRIWKGAGYSAVIYMAAITGIDTEIFEAAVIDGASRFQKIFYIILPLLKTTVILLTLLAVGGIFYGDFGMIYAFIGDNGPLLKTTDVIDTYVFRALRQDTNFGRPAAIGLFQSVIGFILVLATNTVVKKINPESAIF